jgi:drug/metabolite transporter (DMT)-like permease
MFEILLILQIRKNMYLMKQQRMPYQDWVFVVLAIIIVAVWGSTFSATKVLIIKGMSPMGIFFFRFLWAYFILLIFSGKKIFANSCADELKFAIAGILGGSLYYFLQNTALSISQTTNVSFLLSFCPLITIVLSLVLFKDQHISRHLGLGLLIAILGVALVIFNGRFELHISPLGDILALLAATSWAVYSQIIRPLTKQYTVHLISRKVFFYGWITALPLFFLGSYKTDIVLLMRPEVMFNLLYLTLFASICCYLGWNVIIKRLGPVRSASFLYLDPFFSTVFSFLFLKEVMTLSLAMGLILIMLGVFVSQKHLPLKSYK